jgi:hypothetical protein
MYHVFMATNHIKPRDIAPGMLVKFYVHDVGYEDEFMQFCEVIAVKKVRQHGSTWYAVTILEPPTPTRSEPRRSTRNVSPSTNLEGKAGV